MEEEKLEQTNTELETETNLGKEIKKVDSEDKEIKSTNKKNRVQNMLFTFVVICFCCVIFSIILGGIAVYQSITGEDLININSPFNKSDSTDTDSESNQTEEKSEKERAIAFNNEIVNIQLSLIGHFQNLGSTLSTKDITIVDKAYTDSLGASLKAVKTIDEIEAVEGGEDLKIAAKNLFQFYLDSLAGDYSYLVSELRETGNISEESINNVAENISSGEANLDLEFKKAQENLADKYDFQIQ